MLKLLIALVSLGSDLLMPLLKIKRHLAPIRGKSTENQGRALSSLLYYVILFWKIKEFYLHYFRTIFRTFNYYYFLDYIFSLINLTRPWESTNNISLTHYVCYLIHPKTKNFSSVSRLKLL